MMYTIINNKFFILSMRPTQRTLRKRKQENQMEIRVKRTLEGKNDHNCSNFWTQSCYIQLWLILLNST